MRSVGCDDHHGYAPFRRYGTILVLSAICGDGARDGKHYDYFVRSLEIGLPCDLGRFELRRIVQPANPEHERSVPIRIPVWFVERKSVLFLD